MIAYLCLAFHRPQMFPRDHAHRGVAHRKRQTAAAHDLQQKEPDGVTDLEVVATRADSPARAAKSQREPRFGPRERLAYEIVVVDASCLWRPGGRLHWPSMTFQWPPLSGPMRVDFPADLSSRVARSRVRTDFPSRAAISGIESSGVSLSRCRTSGWSASPLAPGRPALLFLPSGGRAVCDFPRGLLG
jgi:hypothetical protein